MSRANQGLFAFLCLLVILALPLGSNGVERLKKRAAPPYFHEGMASISYLLPPPPRAVVTLFESIPLQGALWIISAAIAVFSGVICTRWDHLFAGMILLAGWSGVISVLGIWVWIYSLFSYSTN